MVLDVVIDERHRKCTGWWFRPFRRWRDNNKVFLLANFKGAKHYILPLTDKGEDSRLVRRRKLPKLDTLFSSFFSDASERRVWLSAESKILASTFERFWLYRLSKRFNKYFISSFKIIRVFLKLGTFDYFICSYFKEVYFCMVRFGTAAGIGHDVTRTRLVARSNSWMKDFIGHRHTETWILFTFNLISDIVNSF